MKAKAVRKKKVKPEEPETFGNRMPALREAARYSHRAFAAELGITNDELLGLPLPKRPTNTRLMRKLAQIEKLPPNTRQCVLEHIEGLIAMSCKE